MSTINEASERFAALEIRWKLLRSQLNEEDRAEDFRIRMHRSFSWLRRYESLTEDPDTALMVIWVAFNALFGRWESETGQPMVDFRARNRFTQDIFRLDRDERLTQMLNRQRDLVMAILDDEYVDRYFWVDPGDESARKAKREKFDARTWYVCENHRKILDQTLARVYIVRCQLMHGAATHGGKLNRDSLDRSSAFLEELMVEVMEILIENGSNHDWTGLCYPPQW